MENKFCKTCGSKTVRVYTGLFSRTTGKPEFNHECLKQKEHLELATQRRIKSAGFMFDGIV